MRIYVVFAILLASGCVERVTNHPNNEAHQDAQDDTHHDSQIFPDVIHHQDVGVDGTWGPCEGEGAPSEDVCNGLDDDCDGLVDNTPFDQGMALVNHGSHAFCIDRYEASTQTADLAHQGTHVGPAFSLSGRLPWDRVTLEEAQAACEAAGKRLCSVEEFQLACSGPDELGFPYSDNYEPSTCNTYDRDSTDLYPMATGIMSDCRTETGIHDLSGNYEEWVTEEWDHSNFGHVAGGTYWGNEDITSCDSLAARHPQTSSETLGFRCCRSSEGEIAPDVETFVDPNAQPCDDEGAWRECYTGPSDTLGMGVCRWGDQQCVDGFWSPCEGQVIPTIERCNGLDDNCDGTVDNTPYDTGMVFVDLGVDSFCMDPFEASATGASDIDPGTPNGVAYSFPWVLPWTEVSRQVAQSACQVAHKNLCNVTQFELACGGTQDHAYPYGDVYEPMTCNTADRDVTHPEVLATGTLGDCMSPLGVYDLSGNVQEWLSEMEANDGTVAGGHYQVGEDASACDSYNSTHVVTEDTTTGFRCCTDLGRLLY